MHIGTEVMKRKCVMCGESYVIEDVSFEQRLVADVDFCPRCWNGIMTTTYDNDLENDFSKLRIPA